MQAFPHHYTVVAAGSVESQIAVTVAGLPAMVSASPAEFDGPGDLWSPETFLVGAVADCFLLTFRAVAVASKLPWTSLECSVTGTLDRVDRVTQFTQFAIMADITVPAGTDPDQTLRLLEKTERACLITNSLKATVHLETHIHVAADVTALAGA